MHHRFEAEETIRGINWTHGWETSTGSVRVADGFFDAEPGMTNALGAKSAEFEAIPPRQRGNPILGYSITAYSV